MTTNARHPNCRRTLVPSIRRAQSFSVGVERGCMTLLHRMRRVRIVGKVKLGHRSVDVLVLDLAVAM